MIFVLYLPLLREDRVYLRFVPTPLTAVEIARSGVLGFSSRAPSDVIGSKSLHTSNAQRTSNPAMAKLSLLTVLTNDYDDFLKFSETQLA